DERRVVASFAVEEEDRAREPAVGAAERDAQRAARRARVERGLTQSLRELGEHVVDFGHMYRRDEPQLLARGVRFGERAGAALRRLEERGEQAREGAFRVGVGDERRLHFVQRGERAVRACARLLGEAAAADVAAADEEPPVLERADRAFAPG